MPKEVTEEPEYWRYKGESLIEARWMFEEIESLDETAASIVIFNNLYYTIYAD